MSDTSTQSRTASPFAGIKPNFLIIMVDQQRYPVVYESPELTSWRKTYLKAYETLRAKGLEFKNHYAGSTACVPSRATLYTGQYPSLHGVSQTDGVAKSAYDPDMFWLDPHTVPTIGDYFRLAGYQTFWKGKWHASAADITVPGTHNAFLSYDPNNGAPIPEKERLYEEANVLDEFGFNGWIGPEPHGSNPRNSGSSASTGISGRDVIYKQQTVDLIRHLNQQGQQQPWLIMCSFVNPHDIALFGAVSQRSDLFSFKVDPSVPYITPAPTAAESLITKPSAQLSYRRIYPLALQPLTDTLFYRQLYYSLQLEVDRQVNAVLDALMESSFYENTIVVFTSDHGELLGAHGGLFQKWYQAYEEAIHVPLVIHNPTLFAEPQTTEMLTSHVDLLPTLLGLAGLNAEELQAILKNDHTEVHPLVGRDLSAFFLGMRECPRADEPIYFMTDDNVTKGLNQVSLSGLPYPAVRQPNSIETVIAVLPTGEGASDEVWKFSRYFANPQFKDIPGRNEQYTYRGPVKVTFNLGCRLDFLDGKGVPDQLELYNLTKDPLETKNLANEAYRTPDSAVIQLVMQQILEEQRSQKRLYPISSS